MVINDSAHAQAVVMRTQKHKQMTVVLLEMNYICGYFPGVFLGC